MTDTTDTHSAPIQSSQSAGAAAAARAAHLIVDGAPTIFADTLAEALLADQAEELIGYHRLRGDHPVLAGARAQVTCRSRYTEECLAGSAARGVGQYVILGAGLDSFAYRSPLAGQLRVFEVDQPVTQQLKQQRLSAAQLPVPGNVAYIPVDFETDSLAGRLVAGGFDPRRPAVVSWLGVTMYLTRDAIAGILAVVGGFAAGTELILDYMVPAGLRDAAGQAYVDLVGPVTAGRGEPWLTFLTPPEVSALFTDHSFEPIEHLRQHDLFGPAVWERSDSLRPANLTYLARARVRPAV